MAIKSGDCIIKLKDLAVKWETRVNAVGWEEQLPVHVAYWHNFLEDVRKNAGADLWGMAYDRYLDAELAKFNATMKRTKNWDDQYIKFKTHADFTFFVMRWS